MITVVRSPGEIFAAMVLTATRPLPLGQQAPAFDLPEPLTGGTVALAAVRGDRGTVVLFICNHCPYVLHVIDQLVEVANDFAPRGIGFVAISSNSVESHPQDGPDRMAVFATEHGFPFRYLYDEEQSVARTYEAACTPDIFVYDGDLRSVYRGRLDGSRPGNDVPVDGRDLRAALEALLSGAPMPSPQLPSMGCNIKWKPGNEPVQ